MNDKRIEECDFQKLRQFFFCHVSQSPSARYLYPVKRWHVTASSRTRPRHIVCAGRLSPCCGHGREAAFWRSAPLRQRNTGSAWPTTPLTAFLWTGALYMTAAVQGIGVTSAAGVQLWHGTELDGAEIDRSLTLSKSCHCSWDNAWWKSKYWTSMEAFMTRVLPRPRNIKTSLDVYLQNVSNIAQTCFGRPYGYYDSHRALASRLCLEERSSEI